MLRIRLILHIADSTSWVLKRQFSFAIPVAAVLAGTAPFAAADVDIDSLRARVQPQVPFSGMAGGIAGVLESFRYRDDVVGQHGSVRDRNQSAPAGLLRSELFTV